MPPDTLSSGENAKGAIVEAEPGIRDGILAEPPAPVRRVPLARGLSTRLLLLTILFVLIAEVLIFVPSVANFRLRYLSDRLNTASVAADAFADGAGAVDPQRLSISVLEEADAMAIVVRRGEETRLLTVTAMPDHVDQTVKPTMDGPLMAISSAFAAFFSDGHMILRVLGEPDASGRSIELLMGDGHLREALLVYSRNVGLLALVISLITAGLVFAAINAMLIRPVRRMTGAMLRFARDPDDPASLLVPSARGDELGVAERELAAMQARLRDMLGSQKHLADLGLAVSKINHDMRNVLAGAQLLSDRLAGVSDPAVKAYAPKLMRALDRAVAYSESVLSYGRAQEPPPQRRLLRLHPLVDDVFGLLAAGGDTGIDVVNAVPADLEIDADQDQLYRIVSNLCRNAWQAMAAESEPALVHRLEVSARRDGALVRVTVADTGPGLPEKARQNLFSAFRGSARSGGTGLGLAIARELARAHGGDVELVGSVPGRTVFAFAIADRPVELRAERAARRRSSEGG